MADDERLIRWSLRDRLERAGCEVIEAATTAETVRGFESGVDVVLLDYCLPGTVGFELLDKLRELDEDVPIVMITAHSSVDHAVLAMKRGAYHYVAKPFELDEVVLVVERGLEMTYLRRRVRELTSGDKISSIVGESTPMRKVKALIPRIASSPASTVLITGESGTGKDLAARAIHQRSDRCDEAFVNITCSALPATLLESELFGHERGAFTDAKSRKQGLFEQASGGTVFLDEIGEMQLPLQAKLLRFLEEKRFRRVGGNAELHADVRVVAATNVDLRQGVREGTFREDLYYRLAVLTIHLPPLRERVGDVDLLVAFFLERFNRQLGKKVRNVSADALKLLRTHPWPGNVRELENTLERAAIMSEDGNIDRDVIALTGLEDQLQTGDSPPPGKIDFNDPNLDERERVIAALEEAGWVQAKAARLLNMTPRQIAYRIQTLNIKVRQI